MYPQMETPGGTCTPKQKYEWACWLASLINSVDPDQLASLVNSVYPDQLAPEEAS